MPAFTIAEGLNSTRRIPAAGSRLYGGVYEGYVEPAMVSDATVAPPGRPVDVTFWIETTIVADGSHKSGMVTWVRNPFRDAVKTWAIFSVLRPPIASVNPPCVVDRRLLLINHRLWLRKQERRTTEDNSNGHGICTAWFHDFRPVDR